MDDLLASHADPDVNRRLAGENGLDHRIRIAGSGGAQLEAIDADDLALHLVGQRDLKEDVFDQTGIGQDPADHAAGPLDVAGHSHQAGNGPQRVTAVGLAFQRTAHLNAARRVDGEHPGRLDDFLLWHPGDLGGLLGSKRSHSLPQFLESVGPVIDKFLVPKLFLEDHVHHAHRQGAVGARPRLQMQRGAARVGRGPRVDDDEVLAIVERVDEPVAHLRVGARNLQLLGPHDLGLGELAAPAVIVAIEPPITGDQAIEPKPGTVADIAGSDHVGRAERTGQTVRVPVVAAASSLGDGDGFRAILRLGILDLGFDRAQRLIPADALPFAFSPGASPLDGILDSIRVVDMLNAGESLGAHRSSGKGVGVALNMNGDAILNGHSHTASAMAALTRCQDYLFFAHGFLPHTCFPRILALGRIGS